MQRNRLFITQTEPSWELLIVPAGIVAIAASLKLIDFDH